MFESAPFRLAVLADRKRAVPLEAEPAAPRIPSAKEAETGASHRLDRDGAAQAKQTPAHRAGGEESRKQRVRLSIVA